MKNFLNRILISIFSACLLLGGLLACGETPHTHTFNGSYENDETHHWQQCECDYIANKVEHTLIDGKCVCGYEIKVHSHSFTNYVYNNDATCEDDGTETAICENGCNETDTRTKPNSKLNHNYGNWVSNNDGTHKKVCQNDSEHVIYEDCSGGTATNSNLPLCQYCNSAYLTATSLGVFINDNIIDGYVIVVDGANDLLYESATKLQKVISLITNTQLDIVSESDSKYIQIKQVGKTETASEGFKVYEQNDNLIIECAYMNKFSDAFTEFLSAMLPQNADLVHFYDDYELTIDISKVYYSDFGVKGDGVTNDFYKMKEAHDFANISGQTVYGEEGKTYLITTTVDENNVAQTITIKTNVDWQNSKIIIDDRYFTPSSPEIKESVFTIENDYDRVSFTGDKISEFIPNKKISKTTTAFTDILGYSALVHVYDSNTKMFKRYGTSGGGSQNEIFYVDKNGKLVDTTLLFEFNNVTSIIVYRADNPTITVENAIIETLACKYNLGSGSNVGIKRGFTLSRPNAIVRNLEHVVTGEIPKGEIVDGVAFNGMSNSYFEVLNTHNVLIEGCVFVGRTHYLSGTYDITPSNSHKVLFKNCTQSNFFELKADGSESNRANHNVCWGVMGSNRCKHLDLDNCMLTRYDAHAGVTDGKITNSKIGRISVTGGGNLIVENTKIYAYNNFIITLRSDYGAFWNGTITLRDCHVINALKDDGSYRTQISMIIEADTVNHDFGYHTYFPNLIIDNLKIDKTKKNVQVTFSNRALTDPSISTLGMKDLSGVPNKYAYYPPDFVKVYNNTDKGYKILLPTNNGFFDNTEVVGVVRDRSYGT